MHNADIVNLGCTNRYSLVQNSHLDLCRLFMLYFEINRLVLMVCTRSYIIIQKSIEYAELWIIFNDRYFRKDVNRGFYVRTF